MTSEVKLRQRFSYFISNYHNSRKDSRIFAVVVEVTSLPQELFLNQLTLDLDYIPKANNPKSKIRDYSEPKTLTSVCVTLASTSLFLYQLSVCSNNNQQAQVNEDAWIPLVPIVRNGSRHIGTMKTVSVFVGVEVLL